MSKDPATARFERYFRHPDLNHKVLERGDRAATCQNVRSALWMLGVEGGRSTSDPDLFDGALEDRVRRFQLEYRHRVADGRVGPGTRGLLAATLLARHDASIFLRLQRPQLEPVVFLSYAWRDSGRVDKLDQWLRDHGVSVIRDQSHFEAGVTIPENIRRCIARADKVIAVFSANSCDRDWPRLELAVAEEVERRIGRAVLIYLRLDATPLPAHDPNRLAIAAEGTALSKIGAQILHSLTGSGIDPVRFEYDENEPL